MSEPKETTEKTAGASGRKPLSLVSRVESGHVQQKFSHGRSKTVVVEKKRSRSLKEGEEPVAARPLSPAALAPRPQAAKPAASARAEQPKPGALLRTLSDEERIARSKALAAAQERSVEEARERAEKERLAAVEAAERAARDEVAKAEAKAQGLPEPEPEAPPAPEPEPVAEIVIEAPPPAVELALAASATAVAGGSAAPVAEDATSARSGGMTRPMIVSRGDRAAPKAPESAAKKGEGEVARRAGKLVMTPEVEDDDRAKKKGGKIVRSTVAKPGSEEGRVRGKLTITNAFDERQRERSLASLKRKREREKLKAMGISQAREKVVREVIIPEAITIQELSNRMTERAVDLIKVLMKEGAMHKITDVIDADTAELLVAEFGHVSKRVTDADVLDGFIGAKDEDDNQQPRAPVVTIMGHVDHGKTSLLDAIRKANVASGEAGGITQHIGAYQVTTPLGEHVTFIDTPGHEAFTAMRARGAKVTDIVILVVAADDGVMPQTVEAINHAKAAGVPIIVAINKIDKPDADPMRVRTDLLQHGIVVESLSGDVQDVPVSALKRTGLDKLLEAITLQAEVLELKANASRSAEGFVIEAKLERGRGPVGTLLVQRGTLRVGDIVVAGMAWGRVRALLDDKGGVIKEAGPSVPAEVLGFDSAPDAGDQFAVVESEARAREITDYRVRKRRDAMGSAGTPRTLEQMMQSLKDAAGQKEFTLLIKGDVQGSVEAILGSLKKLGTDEVIARIVHTGVGGITESDIALASASKAVVIGFNVRANAQAKLAADVQGVEIRYYNIIYDLVDDVKAAMSGLLAPTLREVFLGNATIKEVFNITKFGKVAGCQVTDGKLERGGKVRLIRDNVVIHEGTLSILKRFKDDVKEVPAGQECGASFVNYQDIRVGDVIECFNVETIKRSL